MQINTNNVPVAQNGVAYRIYDNRVVIVHPTDNTIITLNSTASALWAAMNGRNSVQQIAADLLVRFEVEEECLLNDALLFFKNMKDRGLVVVR
jgi:hypothetical protein